MYEDIRADDESQGRGDVRGDGDVREEVRRRYAAAALAFADRAGLPIIADECCGSSDQACCGASGGEADASLAADLYDARDRADLPEEALLASLGCGNPTAVAQLREGERVLDLGSGGGIDVLLSAKRVGPSGFAYGVDMTDEMLQMARRNAVKAGMTNVEFVKGTIEEVPLPDQAVDVVISNCVINLSVDKPRVIAEMYRVLVPGGRIGVADIVAEDHLSRQDRAARGSYVGCIAGALSRREYLDTLSAAGFVEADVSFTHPVADGMYSAIVQARKPE